MHIYALVYSICFSLSDLLHSITDSRFIHLTTMNSSDRPRGVGWGGRREAQEGADVFIHRADSCCCIAETNTTLSSNYILIKKKKQTHIKRDHTCGYQRW